MKKIVLLLSLFPLGCSSIIAKEGVYIGSNGKKVSLTSFEYDDVINYQLVGLYDRVGSSVYLENLSSEPLKDDVLALFSAPDNPYTELQKSCGANVKFSGNKLKIETDHGCDSNEKLFFGQYVFSQTISNIPSKYWGEWGDCSNPSYVRRNTFSGNGVYNYSVVGFNEFENGIELDGYAISEGDVINHKIRFEEIDNKMNININYIDDDMNIKNLQKCK